MEKSRSRVRYIHLRTHTVWGKRYEFISSSLSNGLNSRVGRIIMACLTLQFGSCATSKQRLEDHFSVLQWLASFSREIICDWLVFDSYFRLCAASTLRLVNSYKLDLIKSNSSLLREFFCKSVPNLKETWSPEPSSCMAPDRKEELHVN